jgi:LacI family repressor for deo operon, udp, cdd, tsx, nupC, and nupG
MARIESDPTLDTGYAVADQVLAAEPSAVVCFNDLAAIGVISRLRERVVAAPGMSVTGI